MFQLFFNSSNISLCCLIRNSTYVKPQVLYRQIRSLCKHKAKPVIYHIHFTNSALLNNILYLQLASTKTILLFSNLKDHND